MNCVLQVEWISPGEQPPFGKRCFFRQVRERQHRGVGERSTWEQPEDKWKREWSVRNTGRCLSGKEGDHLHWTGLWRIWGGKKKKSWLLPVPVKMYLFIVFVIQPFSCMAGNSQLHEFRCFTDKAKHSFLLNYIVLSCALIKILHYEQQLCYCALVCFQHQWLV